MEAPNKVDHMEGSTIVRRKPRKLIGIKKELDFNAL